MLSGLSCAKSCGCECPVVRLLASSRDGWRGAVGRVVLLGSGFGLAARCIGVGKGRSG